MTSSLKAPQRRKTRSVSGSTTPAPPKPTVRRRNRRRQSPLREGPAARAFDYLLSYSSGPNNQDKIEPHVRAVSHVLSRIYPAGLELPVVAALFQLALSRCITEDL